MIYPDDRMFSWVEQPTGHEPLVRYAWDIRTASADQCGVTRDPNEAIEYVDAALRAEPAGATGTVRRVALSPSGGAEYSVRDVIGKARLDPATGIVVWTEP
ncbi:hypothetical protein AGRA3207_005305 [Actinomadura graeca]|uniref:Uncharacterized protein n=1 Tax=Actinomadura graeca TaxID=2750812 RepID=A0ABX8R1B7_9ACTN|nr:hypothetical protein [Actinomadura graeca]QXJ24054.1 hypothetical protein AGRA3207_005305 [Actinomadura graeca]